MAKGKTSFSFSILFSFFLKKQLQQIYEYKSIKFLLNGVEKVLRDVSTILVGTKILSFQLFHKVKLFYF